ncbi:DUF255 domain-containing protein [Gulosibacter chungangensis]|uniref:DUF255 domain-containing protein n=1 Tax=Gulosibacter chungangensis TaxID=979746 RepID=A0A7J5B9A0_9MICO|nr:DUF255 domain-containing protein [Gulosibacter chungangensis]
MPNGLADSTSSFLRQHADQPIDWQPWGEDAFAQARERGVPTFISIGHASCHWCHVMARESFEDPEVAAFLNANFVSFKVDREEHPAVDSVYLDAALGISGKAAGRSRSSRRPMGMRSPPVPISHRFARAARLLSSSWRRILRGSGMSRRRNSRRPRGRSPTP